MVGLQLTMCIILRQMIRLVDSLMYALCQDTGQGRLTVSYVHFPRYRMIGALSQDTG